MPHQCRAAKHGRDAAHILRVRADVEGEACVQEGGEGEWCVIHARVTLRAPRPATSHQLFPATGVAGGLRGGAADLTGVPRDLVAEDEPIVHARVADCPEDGHIQQLHTTGRRGGGGASVGWRRVQPRAGEAARWQGANNLSIAPNATLNTLCASQAA